MDISFFNDLLLRYHSLVKIVNGNFQNLILQVTQILVDHCL
jgi:hypothetical protein